MSEERFDRIEQRLDELTAQVSRQGEDLGRQMRVLHEDAIERIEAIPEYTGPTRAEFNQGMADLREVIERRLDPLEATVRRLGGA